MVDVPTGEVVVAADTVVDLTIGVVVVIAGIVVVAGAELVDVPDGVVVDDSTTTERDSSGHRHCYKQRLRHSSLVIASLPLIASNNGVVFLIDARATPVTRRSCWSHFLVEWM